MTTETHKGWRAAYWIATAAFFLFSAPRISYFMGAYSSPDWFFQVVAWTVGALIELPVYAACMGMARMLRPPHTWGRMGVALFLFVVLVSCSLYSWHASNDYTAHFRNEALLSGTQNVFLSAYDTELASAIPFFIILLSLIEPILFGSSDTKKKKKALTDEEFEEEKKWRRQKAELNDIRTQHIQVGIENQVGAVVLGVAGGFKKLQKSPRQDKVRGKSLENIEENQQASKVEEKIVEEASERSETISPVNPSSKVEERTLPELTFSSGEEMEKGGTPPEEQLMQEGGKASLATRITGPLVVNQEIHVRDQEEAFQESRECCTDEIALPENTAKRKSSVSIPTLVPLMEAPEGFSTRKPYFTDDDGVEWTSLKLAAKNAFKGQISEDRLRTALASGRISHVHFKVIQTRNGGDILVISTSQKTKKEVTETLKAKKAAV